MIRVARDDQAGIEAAVGILGRGGIVGLPTDTVYGIAVTLDAPGGIERLFAAKGRPADRAIMILADSLDQVADIAETPVAALALGRAFWPGGLTVVLPLRPGATLPAALSAGTPTLGVRVPDHATPRALARTLGPLPTTSANRSGEPEARLAAEVIAALGDAVELVLDGGRTRGGTPSSVVDCSVDRPRLLRAGAIDREALASVLDAAGVAHDL